MGRKLPPFSAVRAFEAAARHLSFKCAAEELCLSPSAISHQVRALEAYLDTRLFERQGNALALTLTGRGYAGRMTTLLDSFEESSRSVAEAGKRPLRILCTPGFAARWLVPRLGSLPFASQLRLQVSQGAPSTDFARNGADVVIQWCDDPTPGVRVEPIMTSHRYPVISPALRAATGIARPEDLTRLTLIHDEVMDAWADWFLAAGVTPPQMPRGPVYPNCELATTAVEQGQGVSLAYDVMVRGTLASGRLERLFDTVTLPVMIYALAYPETRAGDPMILAFRAWLFSELAADGHPAAARTAAE